MVDKHVEFESIKRRKNSFLARRQREKEHLDKGKPREIDRIPDKADRERDEHKRKENHLRAMPYPFTGMLAITNDIDSSNRELYGKYTRQLVVENGLDLGSSVWLSANRVDPNSGLAFMGPDLRIDRASLLNRIAYDMTPYELANEVHKGNIDHWHFFLPRGPRVIISRKCSIKNGKLVFTLPPEPQPDELVYDYDVRPFPVYAAQVTLSKKMDLSSAQLTIVFKEDTFQKSTFVFKLYQNNGFHTFSKWPKNEDKNYNVFFAATPSSDSTCPIPMAHLVERVFIEADGCHSDIDGSDMDATLYLFNVHTQLIFDRLTYLRENFGVLMNTATVHGRWHLIQKLALRKINQSNKEQMKKIDQSLVCFPGEIKGKDLYFSTMADDPSSFARIFPDIQKEFGFHKIRFGGTYFGRKNNTIMTRLDPGEYFFPDNAGLVYPVLCANSSVVFNILATMSEVPEDYASYDDFQRTRTTAASFDARMDKLMCWFRKAHKADARYRGKGIFFYTHLGKLMPWKMPKYPYFDPHIVGLFRDSHYGSFGEREPRIWFTRSSVLSDFVLVNQALIELAEVDYERSVVDIISVEDPFTHSKMPSGSKQLYGQTFYVKDAASARIVLDGKEITGIQRNPKKSGEPSESVTVVDCGIRSVLFNNLNPLSSRTSECQGTVWKWIKEPDGRTYGRLCLRANDTGYALIDFTGIHLMAAQHLFYLLRRSGPESAFGIEWQVTTGGIFYFGDKSAFSESKDYTGYYLFDRRYGSKTGWTHYAIPFFDLNWSKPVEGTTLPNHSLYNVKLIINGREDCWIDLSLLELGRPRTTELYPGEDCAVIGGTVPACAESVHLMSTQSSVTLNQTKVDDLNGFSFPKVPYGAYQIGVFDKENALIASQEIEVRSDRFDIQL